MSGALITAAVALVVGWSSLLLGAIKWLLDKNYRLIEKRFDLVENAVRANGDDVHRVELELKELKASLPVEYVRREDDIRNQFVMDSKLDATWGAIENLRKTHYER